MAAIVAAVAVPVAPAKSVSRTKLSVLPLPRSAIGAPARSLPLQPDSGYAPNTDAAKRGMLLTPTRTLARYGARRWRHVGRSSGYALDYGLGASGGAGVTEVYTSVDRYKTHDDAEKGLYLWRSYDQRMTDWLGQSGGRGLAFSLTPVRVAPLGGDRQDSWAFLASYSAANIAPVYGLDEQFTQGRYEAHVSVWAGNKPAATMLARSLARKLDTRIKQALKGKLRAKPVKLPPPQPQPGPPSGGPDLTALAFRPADYSTFGPLSGKAYFIPELDPTALSAYELSACGPYLHGGCTSYLDQEIDWCPSVNQASFMADLSATPYYETAGFSPVDLSSVGDGAQGFVGAGAGAVVLSSGPLMEFIRFAPAWSASDVHTLAQTAANYINAAGLGS